ncbi:Homeodomain-like DNA binding domain-containing transcription factor [Mucor lusitanicus]
MSEENVIDAIMDDLLTEESQLEQDHSSSEDESGEVVDARQKWAIFMRNQFSVRAEFPSTESILKANGRLNQDEERAWTDVERDLLIQGIQQYGIGNWNDIRKELLNEWTSNDLRLKCIRLIGRQNLQLYKDWKGNADEIQQEYENNKRIGSKYGTWKQSVLVYDDDGKVEEELMAYHQK